MDEDVRLLSPEKAIDELEEFLARESRKMSPRLHDREDLLQEMCLGILEAGRNGGKTLNDYKQAALKTAFKYLGKLRSAKYKPQLRSDADSDLCDWQTEKLQDIQLCGSSKQNGVAGSEIVAQALPDEGRPF